MRNLDSHVYFLHRYVGRDPNTGKSCPINQLGPLSEKEQELFDEGATRSAVARATSKKVRYIARLYLLWPSLI